jgi:hypothetical protein
MHLAATLYSGVSREVEPTLDMCALQTLAVYIKMWPDGMKPWQDSYNGV